MAYTVMAYIVMAQIVMAYISLVMAYVDMAYIRFVMAYIGRACASMAYIDMAETFHRSASLRHVWGVSVGTQRTTRRHNGTHAQRNTERGETTRRRAAMPRSTL